MTWFFIALIAPFVWAISNYLDKYLLNKYITGYSPMVLIIFSSIVGIIVAPLILPFAPEAFNISLFEAFVLMLSGALYVIGLIPYLFALEEHDTSLAVPIFQMIPVISYFLAFIFLGEILTTSQIIASILIIIGAVGIAINWKEGIHFQKKVFWLMVLASFLIALDSLLFKFVAIETSFITGAFWKYVGFIIPSIFILLFQKKSRDQFVSVVKSSGRKVIGFNLVNEGLNTVGVLVFSLASLLVPLTLAWIVVGFQPVFSLIFGVILTLLFPKIIKEDISFKIIAPKFIFIVIMLIGVSFL